jgi:AmiR/NasT family two-component response regulator
MVLAPAGKRRDALCDQLRRSVGTVEAAWPIPESIAAEIGILVVAIVDLPSDSTLYRMERRNRCLIGLIEEDNPAALKGIVDLGVHATLGRSGHPMAVVMALALGVSISTYETRIRTKLGKLENNLRSAHTVERAVRILARSLNIPEDQAYQHLRTKAMDRRESMNELAQQVIRAHAIIDDMTSNRTAEATSTSRLRVVHSSEVTKD